VTAAKPTEVAVEGTDEQLVGQVAANIREWRKPAEVVSMRERMNVMTKIMWVIGAGIITALITHFQEML